MTPAQDDHHEGPHTPEELLARTRRRGHQLRRRRRAVAIGSSLLSAALIAGIIVAARPGSKVHKVDVVAPATTGSSVPLDPTTTTTRTPPTSSVPDTRTSVVTAPATTPPPVTIPAAVSTTQSSVAPPPSSTTATTAAPAAPGTCRTPQLRLSSGRGTAAGGTGYTTYFLTNTGSDPCTMVGYPGVAILDAAGHVVQRPAGRDPHPGTTTPVPVAIVTLAPGARAAFLLASVDTTPNPDCPTLYTGTTLQVYPPNQTVPILQPYKGGFCDLAVGPVH